MKSALAVLTAAFLISACATGGGDETAAAPPSLVTNTGQPAPPQARFYVDCITQAAAANTFDREGNVIRFHCDGAVAQRFYDGLAGWVSEGGAQYEGDGATWRFTTPIQQNPSFRDFCRHTSAHYDCTVVLNVGEFLAE